MKWIILSEITAVSALIVWAFLVSQMQPFLLPIILVAGKVQRYAVTASERSTADSDVLIDGSCLPILKNTQTLFALVCCFYTSDAVMASELLKNLRLKAIAGGFDCSAEIRQAAISSFKQSKCPVVESL